MERIRRHFYLLPALALLAALILPGCNRDDEEYILDGDGNKYSVIHIAGHYWMKQNLRTLSYSDGSDLLIVQHDAIEWASASSACCIYDPDGVDGIGSEGEMRTNYGVLYNWYAVTDNSGLCPTGWRIPTSEDWEDLIAELGGDVVAGGKLKGLSTDPDDHPRWNSPNEGATNESGFNAYPAGCRTSFGEFFDIGDYAYWWTASEYDNTFAISWYVGYDGTYIDYQYRKKRTGYSVRCIRD